MQIRILAVLLAMVIPAYAVNKTVKAGGGGDFTTIQACATAISAGDSCTVFAGTYNEDVTVASGTVGNYKTMTVNTGDTVNVYSFTIGSHVKIDHFHIHHDASPINAPCVSINSGGQTDYFITNNVMSACGTYIIKEDFTSNTTHGYIGGNTLSYSCSTSSSPNVCSALVVNGDYHLIENNDISHVSDGPFVFGIHNVVRNNTFHDVIDTDCGSNSGNCHIDFMQEDANVVGGAQPAAYLLVENNAISNMVNTGTFAGAGMHAGPLLQAEVCNGQCQNAIVRYNTASHISGGGTTNDNGGVSPPPQAWINVKSYNNDWVDMLVGLTAAGFGVNGHDYGSINWAQINEIYQFQNAYVNQTNPYYCASHNSPCTGAAYGNNLAFCTGGNCSSQLFGHLYNSGAFTADPGNVYADPLFNNYAGNDFSLAGGSPAINTGTSLTTVASGDSGSGTSLVVTDAGFFQDGSGIVNGDCISVTTTTNHVCVTAVNYSTNTLTLASGFARAHGDAIWLYSDSTGRVVLPAAGPNMGSQFAAVVSSGVGRGWHVHGGHVKGTTVVASACGGLPFSDNFNRANGGLGACWTNPSTAPIEIVSDAATVPATTGAVLNVAFVTVPGFTTSQYAQVTLTTQPASTTFGLSLFATDANNYYFLYCPTGSACSLFTCITTVPCSQAFIGSFSTTPVVGNTVCFEIDSGTTAKVKIAGSYDSPMTITGSTLTGPGAGGLFFYQQNGTTSAVVNSFQTGNGTCP